MILVIIDECDCDTGSDKCDEDGQQKVDYHDSVESLLVFTHFVDVLAQIHNQLRVSASVNNQSANIARVLNIRAAVQELIQVNVIKSRINSRVTTGSRQGHDRVTTGIPISVKTIVFIVIP